MLPCLVLIEFILDCCVLCPQGSLGSRRMMNTEQGYASAEVKFRMELYDMQESL